MVWKSGLMRKPVGNGAAAELRHASGAVARAAESEPELME